MGNSRRTEIERHLPEEEIDKLLREAEDDPVFGESASSKISTEAILFQRLLTE